MLSGANVRLQGGRSQDGVLTDVLDEASTAAATAFYAEQPRDQSATRCARRGNESSPRRQTRRSLSGVILCGDPWHSIGEAADDEVDDLADDLLDAYLVPERKTTG
jgi:hypothetical protein